MSRLPNSEPFGSRLKTYLIEGGGRTWARTKDPLIKSQLLYQLSYASDAGLRHGGEPSPRLVGRLLAGHVRPAKGVFDIFLAVGTECPAPTAQVLQ